MSNIGGAVGAALSGILAGNPYLMILGKLLQPKTDWKAVILKEGIEEAKRRVSVAWNDHLAKKGTLGKIASAMSREGWSWAAAGDEDFLRTQKVEISEADRTKYGDKLPGFLISRDAVYAILRETGVPGGAFRDGWRDAVDNSVWEHMQDRVTSAMPLSEIVSNAATELRRVIL